MRPLAAATLVALFAMPSPARAGSGAPGSAGLGVVIGDPTGVSAKIRLTPSSALDAALGAGDGADLHLHLDWLFVGAPFVRESNVSIAWFAGVGGALEVDDDEGRFDDDDDTELEARAPLGITMRFDSVPPLELFAEIALAVEVVDDVDTEVDGGIGVRWFF